MSLTTTPAWQALKAHREILPHHGACFEPSDVARLEKFDIRHKGLRLNYAFQKITSETIKLLMDLARQQNLEDWRSRMFAGEKINVTENRAVLHTALRQADDQPVIVDGVDVMPEVRHTQRRIENFVEEVRSGKRVGATQRPFRTIVNIGIGGSDLGPRFVAEALSSFRAGIDIYFVANVDAFELQNVLAKVDPSETLFVIVSKTFTTQETLMNARMARQWLVEAMGEDAVAYHFVAVSVNQGEVQKFGVEQDNMFPMWDWIGGRYSLWSAVGLSLALAFGNTAFRELLAGASAMDKHFQTAPLESNMPVLLAMIGIWNRNFLGSTSLAILPYCERLRNFPRYLQQLEMESNGKSVTRAGASVDYGTSPVLFGDCGTVGQHSFHQCLHQGQDAIPADFIVVAEDDLGEEEHHRALLSNLAAQMAALAFGQAEAAIPQDIYEGGRGSNLIMLETLDPYHLGLLLALYEHKTFVQGIIWEINSFDQPGVELGKRMAKSLENRGSTENAPSLMDAFFTSLNRSHTNP